MKRRRAHWVVLTAAVAALTGCVYLRLLEIKKQLRDFDENFSVGGRPDLVITFKKPVLRTSDVKFLIGAEPLSTSEEGESIYHYEFEMVRSTDAGPPPPLEHLSLQLAFQDGKLVKIIVPETFMLLFPRGMLINTLRQAANAQVFETKRLARAKVELDERDEVMLPSRSRAIFLLGPPAATSQEGEWETLTYNYRITRAGRKVPITGWISFDSTGSLHLVRVRWDLSTVEAEYSRS